MLFVAAVSQAASGDPSSLDQEYRASPDHDAHRGERCPAEAQTETRGWFTSLDFDDIRYSVARVCDSNIIRDYDCFLLTLDRSTFLPLSSQFTVCTVCNCWMYWYSAFLVLATVQSVLHMSAFTDSHTFIHWWWRLPRKVPSITILLSYCCPGPDPNTLYWLLRIVTFLGSIVSQPSQLIFSLYRTCGTGNSHTNCLCSESSAEMLLNQWNLCILLSVVIWVTRRTRWDTTTGENSETKLLIIMMIMIIISLQSSFIIDLKPWLLSTGTMRSANMKAQEIGYLTWQRIITQVRNEALLDLCRQGFRFKEIGGC